MSVSRPLIAALLCSVPTAAFAQEAETPAPAPEEIPVEAAADVQPDAQEEDLVFEEESENEIVVTGQRPRGSVLGDIPAEVTLNPAEIRSYGASNVNELLEALAPQTGSGRGRGGGRPVVLVNGRRISSFSEVRDIPPEAISRVEIFPEEVALRYGYRADQRVVNLVLRRRFDATTVELEGGVATAGGRGVAEVDVDYLQIAGPTRTQFGIEYQNQAALLESERDIIQAIELSDVDIGDFRSLLGENESIQVNGTHSRNVFGNVAATFDARFTHSRSDSLLGLPSNDPGSRTPLTRQGETWNNHVGLGLNGDIAPWRWNFTANYDRVENDSETERLAGVAPDVAESVNQSADAQLVLNGPVVSLPAGRVNASVRLGGELRSFDSQSTRAGIFQETSLSRERLDGQASFDIPITSRRNAFLDAIGDLSVNVNVGAEELSDFGTLTTLGYGFNWRPTGTLSFIGSVTHEEGAPSITQLGNPVIATPNVRVFDFVRGESVDITRIDGGNPNLNADSRRVINLGVNWRPLQGNPDLSFRANYVDSVIDNPISEFPAATAEVEAVFPERFVRDADGRLISLDTRPINFARAERREIRWGVDFSTPWGPQPQRGQGPFGGARGEGRQGGGEGGQQAGQGPRGPGGGRGGFGGGGGFGRGGGQGRIQLGLFHTWRLEDRVFVNDNGPVFDYLGGSAAGSGGGTPEHQVQARASLFRNGFGGFVSADWQSGTTVRGGRDGDLEFSPRTTVNLRLFANLGQMRGLVRDVPFIRGTRVTLSIDNLFDAHPEVRDAFGDVPISYQPDLLDPVGRSVRISLRKQFF
ncbi:MAG: TonB-dependent receptor plug domain-containing protein [Allosphingosinicella sp.]|uniref:TonB-dependent receptor plug domain-containing protein n=1 Tax=Allosphingosinicella sp. TaxID=2823234 RepID=UPI0039507BAD